MKAIILFRNVLKTVIFILSLVWTSLGAFAQCPIVTDSNPPPVCDTAGLTYQSLTTLLIADGVIIDNGATIVYYDALVGGNQIDNDALTIESLFYVDDNNTGVDCSPRQEINISFAISASNNQFEEFYCSDENPTVQTFIDDALQSSIPFEGSVIVYNDFATNDIALPTQAITSNLAFEIVFVDAAGCKSQLEDGLAIYIEKPDSPLIPSPQSFCNPNGTVFTIADLDIGAAANIEWYNSSDASGAKLTSTTVINDGDILFAVVSTFPFPCDSETTQVDIIIDEPFDPGTPGNDEFCDNNIPVVDIDLFLYLGGSKDSNGTWSGPTTITSNPEGTTNISTLGVGVYNYTYTVPVNGTCPEDTSNVTITIYETYSSGVVSTGNPASYCEMDLPATFDLSALLDNEDPNGQWTQGTLSTDPVVTSPIDLSGFIPGTYNFTYTQNGLPNPCPEESRTVQVIVLQDPDAGNAINQLFCENDLVAKSPFDLFDALDGTQDDNSGTWTDASNATISNSIDITGFTVEGSPYQFTYTISNGMCEDMEIISITVETAPESGTPVGTIPEYCEGAASASYDLFDLLNGEDQTGAWFMGTDNTGTAISNPTDLSGLTAGTYNFTYDVNAIGSCDDVLVTVSIIINPLPNTGIPTPAIFCENDVAGNSPLDLLGQLAGNDSGGGWSDDNTSGALTGTDVNLNLLSIGSYNFTYSITDANGCSNSSTVVITVEDAPESGTANAPLEFCISDITTGQGVNLFDLLEGEDQSGVWNDDTPSGALSGNTLTIDGLVAGTYNFTYDVNAIGSCDDVMVTVSVIINPLPNTGIPTPAIFCENDVAGNSPLDLLGQLSGNDSGGTWTDDNATGALTGTDVDLNLLTIGSNNFTYSITDTNGCKNSSTVRVTITDAPESGSANSPLEFCVSNITIGQTVNLFDLLEGEDQSGVWNDDMSSGALSGNVVTIDGLTAANYNFTFDVNAIGSCDDVLVTVSIIINDTPAPTAAASQEFCDSATIADLVPTGTDIKWYADASGGSALDGTTALIDAETYYATQTDAATGCESSVRTLVTANIHQTPNSGGLNTTSIVACNDNNNIDLFAGLDSTQDAGGVWNNDDSVGSLTGNMLDATGALAGTYNFTYLVTALSPCIDASTTISVTIDAPLNAGTSPSPLEICSNNGTIDLFTLIGSADVGGTWTPAMASTTGVFDPLVDGPTTYTYTLTNACGTFSSDVEVNVTQAPNAGTDNSLSMCVIDGTIDLFALLGSAQTGGTWFPTLTSATGVFDPLVDPAGVYTYTITATSPCLTDSNAKITVTVNNSATPIVVNPDPKYCKADSPIVSDLNVNITALGTINWYDDTALTIPLNATDILVDGEDYYATQTNSTGCESTGNVKVDVTVNDTPTPTMIDPNAEYCINDNPSINNLSLNITGYNATTNNIAWYDSETGGTAIDNSSLLTNITYYVALIDAVTDCESSERLEVTPNLAACGVLKLPDGFSPNDDGVNDTYEVDNLAILYPNFDIEIYNRYGNIVYKGKASSPRFDGRSTQSRTLGNGDLPVGIYFYIFKFNDGVNKPEQGKLYLSR
jgi:gliding motility-associated-like protein